MNIETFYSELSSLCDSGDWKLTYFNRRLRNKKNQCPLTALAQEKTGRILSSKEWKKAGEALGLSLSDAVSIVQGADKEFCVKGCGPETIRTRLLSVLL